MPHWIDQTTLLGITLFNWGAAALAAAVAWLLMRLALRVVLRRLQRLAAHTRTQVDDALADVLAGTSHGLLLLAALLVGLGLLDLPPRWSSRVGQLWFLAVALQLGLWLNRLIDIGLRRHAERHRAPGTGQASAAATLMSWGLRTLLWAIVVLGMLSNLGVNVTAFIASLGVGGIAVALAAQSILGDLFASLVIAIDKPFEIGDAIAFGSVSGTVEAVGVKTTRIRSPGGEQIVMSNAELLKQTVSNYKRLQQRRIVFGFGVSYDTPADRVEAIPGVVQDIVQAGQGLQFGRAHFKKLGDSALEFEVVYTVLDADYDRYMGEQQRINLALMRELAARGVGFAFPSRAVYVADQLADGRAGQQA